MRAVSILTGPSTHLDHLGVLSALLEIPLIVTEEKTHAQAAHYYPDIAATCHDLSELSYAFLAKNFEMIFESGKFFALQFGPFLNLLYNKKMRFVFCPHGNSDKGHSLKEHVEQDIALVYGNHLLDLWKKTGAAEKIAHILPTGNYRYPYYLKHRAFYDALAQREVFCHFKREKPLIFYAPTCGDKEAPSSFFDTIEAVIEELLPSFDLLIKPHPLLIDDHPARHEQLKGKYEKRSGVFILEDFPPIYPLLAQCDLYLGDSSSIGYDFLVFDKPLYFFNSDATYLKRCGIEVELKSMREQIEQSWKAALQTFQAARQEAYAYAFGSSFCAQNLKSLLLEKEGEKANA